jgi:hypothetical protein
LLNTCADILKEEMKELKELRRLEEQLESANSHHHHHHGSNIVRLNSKASKAFSKLANGQLSSNSSNPHNNSNSLNASKNGSTNGSSKSLSGNKTSSAGEDKSSSANLKNTEKEEELTWIHELFQGILVNETKCLNCETSSSKEENFLDLSVDVEQNTSISHCLQEFSNMEMLCGECKYYCETCSSKQEAEKRLDHFFLVSNLA